MKRLYYICYQQTKTLNMKKYFLLLLVALFIAACNNRQPAGQTTDEQAETETTEAVQQVAATEVVIIYVSGMHCEGCEKAITGAITALEGVQEARVSWLEEQAKVKYDPSLVGIDQFRAAIEDKGYTVSEYEILPLAEQAGGQNE